MYQPALVRVVKGLGEGMRNRYALADRHLALSLKALAERATFKVRNHQKESAIVVTTIENADDVGVLKSRCNADLLQKPASTERLGQLRAQDLDRDPSIVPNVAGEIHYRARSASERTLDCVSADDYSRWLGGM